MFTPVYRDPPSGDVHTRLGGALSPGHVGATLIRNMKVEDCASGLHHDAITSYGRTMSAARRPVRHSGPACEDPQAFARFFHSTMDAGCYWNRAVLGGHVRTHSRTRAEEGCPA